MACCAKVYVCATFSNPSPAVKRSWKTGLDSPDQYTLGDVVRNVHPTILIGCSAQPGAFTEDIVKTMAAQCERPVIMPLSNPTRKAEACRPTCSRGLTDVLWSLPVRRSSQSWSMA